MTLLALTFQIFVLTLSLFFLGKTADFLLTAISRLGYALHLSRFLTGFVLLGIATSIPEAFIAINSIATATPQLSLGNLLGANIVLLTLISGLAAVIAGQVVVKHDFRLPLRLAQIALLITAPILVLFDSHLSRLDGLFLALFYFAYLTYIYRLHPTPSPPLHQPLLNYKLFHSLLLIVLGLFGVIISSQAAVSVSVRLANQLSIPPLVIGLLVLSIGTNLPEISVVLAAIKKHEPGLILGDVLGSAASNTFIISLLGLFSPLRISFRPTYFTASLFIAISLVAFIGFTRSKNQLSRWEGVLLIALYFIYVISEIISGTLTAQSI